MTLESDLNSADLLHGFEAIGAFLGISARKVRHWCQKTDLPTFKIGRTVCARRSTLKAWLAAQDGKANG